MSEQGATYPAKLLARGYRVFPGGNIDGEIRFFQKRFEGPHGTRYFLNFREWDHSRNGTVHYDATISGDTDTGGYAWVTLREGTIEATEQRAERVWEAMGCAYYERTFHEETP